MQIRLALFLLAGVLVYGCAQQDEMPQTPRRSEFVQFVSTQMAADSLPSAASNRRVTVHDVKLDGYCPDDVLLKGRDIVRFVNNSGMVVRITDLDSKGRKTASGQPTDVSLSDVKSLVLPDTNGHGRRRTVGLIEVNTNPFKGEYLTFHYGVTYQSQGKDQPCSDDPDGEKMLWSVPPTMIVGPDTTL